MLSSIVASSAPPIVRVTIGAAGSARNTAGQTW
jgi:hypothetical protein